MHRRTSLWILALSLVAGACGSESTAPRKDGPLKLGIVSGNGQIATAGDMQLPKPVEARLVRQDDGSLAFDWLVRPLYAQGTVVNGSPVPGAVVCAVQTAGAGELKAFTPCVNTDQDGRATFSFEPGTTAGDAKAEIRGQVEGQPAVFDSVFATIRPGPIYTFAIFRDTTKNTHFRHGISGTPDRLELTEGDSLDVSLTIGATDDQYGNAYMSVDEVVASASPSWALYPYAASAPSSPEPQHTGWHITPQAAGKYWLFIWLADGALPAHIPLFVLSAD